MKENTKLISVLFRQEFSKMVAVISRIFGLDHIEVAEDIVSESFLLAAEKWEDHLPPNPTAWLYLVAKQKTIHYLRRNKTFDKKIAPDLKSASTFEEDETNKVDFSLENIRDSQLKMMFAVCSPAIASEAQIALALRILCGFSIDEIAEAFLTNKDTINKRLFRAKERLRKEQVGLELPSRQEMEDRLDNVLHIIYLLFNEGYYSSTENNVLRKDLCHEALHLGLVLAEFRKLEHAKTNALVALMCFHASRLNARMGRNNQPVLYENQDEELWDKELIEKGKYFLELSAQGNEISSYHLEAGIAFWNCEKEDSSEKWESILHHYDLLLEINYSPAVALNRLYALYKARGREEALQEAMNWNASGNHFYHTLLGELYKGQDDQMAAEQFIKALGLARTEAERQVIREKMKGLSG
jgi:RNA polymerase sigma factor (sigma-70 family)